MPFNVKFNFRADVEAFFSRLRTVLNYIISPVRDEIWVENRMNCRILSRMGRDNLRYCLTSTHIISRESGRHNLKNEIWND